MQLSDRHVAGFMLIEVLVSLFLLALGATAWLSAQASALRQTRLGQHQSMALMLAGDMAERLRASPAVAQAMAFSSSFQEQAVLTVPTCLPGLCDAAAWALADAALWRQQVRQALPQGSAVLDVDPVGRSARIILAWREASAGDGLEGAAWDTCAATLAVSPGDSVRCLSLGVMW